MEKDLAIIYNTCKYHLGKLNTKKQDRERVFRRWIYFKIAHELTICTMEEIGKKAGRNHATVSHGLLNFDRDIKDDLLVKYNDIRTACMIRLNRADTSKMILDKKRIFDIGLKIRITKQRICSLQSQLASLQENRERLISSSQADQPEHESLRQLTA